MDKITAIRVKLANGTYSDNIPFCTSVENVSWNENNNLTDILGAVDLNKGNIQTQLDLKNNFIYGASSGSKITFFNGADNVLLKSLKINIDPIQ
jgi:hypothetical protein